MKRKKTRSKRRKKRKKRRKKRKKTRKKRKKRRKRRKRNLCSGLILERRFLVSVWLGLVAYLKCFGMDNF